jgi:SAM-dependent methyltransferase
MRYTDGFIDDNWFQLLADGYHLNVGEESRKTWEYKARHRFFDKYMSGYGLDIGGTGYLQDVKPILPNAEIIGLDYLGYDGITLPFPNNSQDYIYSSHMLEYVDDRASIIKDWMRVLKFNGHIICVVPHRDLYEKKLEKPSRFNEDHRVFFTPASLLAEFEVALPINSFRVRHMQDNDKGHFYTDPPEIHSRGQYEIELVLQKL